MNDYEAMKILVAKRGAINDAINAVNEYSEQLAKGHLTSATVKKAMRDSAIINAAFAGADISEWDGTPAPGE